MTEPERRLRLAVLVSGGGTNLQALMDRSADGTLQAHVVAVLSDQEDAYGLTRAQNAGIPGHYLDYGAFKDHSLEELRTVVGDRLEETDRRQRILDHPDGEARRKRLARRMAAEKEMIRILEGYAPDYICLAGFMRLLTPFFLQHWNRGGRWRVLNIHPALLPAFPGQHGYEDTFAYGCKWGGVTVHFVDEGEDSGPVIAQAVYPLWPREGLEGIRRRGLQLEYQVYAQCINWLAQGHVKVEKRQEGERLHARIDDPAYGDILRRWTEQALGTP